MSAPNLNWSTCLITGGAGGIGKELAKYFISQNKIVLIAGRTESNLKATAAEINAAGYYVLDTGKTASIPEFIERLVREHPELDCIVNNAGVQRPLKAVKDDAGKFLESADQEIDINVRGPMHLAIGLLPHFRQLVEKSSGTKTTTTTRTPTIINVSSVLGFVPFSILNPVYNGTKAFLHFWSLALRVQLKEAGVRVIEIAPPAVGTDLHRDREDPDDNKKHKNPTALTLEEFMGEVVPQLEGKDGVETISAGPGKQMVQKWEDAYGEMFGKAAGGWKS